MDMDIFYKAAPRPARLLLLSFSFVASIVGIWMAAAPLFFFGIWASAVIIYKSVRDPKSWIALQQDVRNREDVNRFNRFVDALAAGGVIDAETLEEDIEIEENAPLVYTVRLHQFGKTGNQLQKACAASLNALGAVDVEVKQTAPSEYIAVFSPEFPHRILSDTPCAYADIVDDDITIQRLPVGVFLDGSPVEINLESRNMLLNGNPRSGKSVLLSCLVADLARINACHYRHGGKKPIERVIVMSPKILDFQTFEGCGIRLIQDIEEMSAVLNEIHAEAEARKAWCVAHNKKKVSPEDYEAVGRHITVVIDEYTVIKTSTIEDEKGKTVKIGDLIEQKIMRLVAETGFAAISFVLATQRVSSTNMSTNLRDLIAGARCSFATETIESTKMILGDYASEAPCHDITTDQKGVGYISLDGVRPRPFKGAYASEADERAAADLMRGE